MHALADQLLDLWFGGDSPTQDHQQRWWMKDEAFDAQVRDAFGEHVERAAANAYADWESSAKGALALVLLLDQVPRNAFRGTPRSFAYDAAARAVSWRALGRGDDAGLAIPLRAFMYMPLMHSEHLSDHAECVMRFERLAHAASGGPWQEMAENFLKFQHSHQAIIRRWGRYPHRNAILGRYAGADEVAWLAEHGGF